MNAYDAIDESTHRSDTIELPFTEADYQTLLVEADEWTDLLNGETQFWKNDETDPTGSKMLWRVHLIEEQA